MFGEACKKGSLVGISSLSNVARIQDDTIVRRSSVSMLAGESKHTPLIARSSSVCAYGM